MCLIDRFVDQKLFSNQLILRVRLVREFWRGGAGRGGEIFNLKCLVQFLEGEGREGEESKSF